MIEDVLAKSIIILILTFYIIDYVHGVFSLEADDEFLKIELEKQKIVLDSALMSMDEAARRRFLLQLTLKYLIKGRT